MKKKQIWRFALMAFAAIVMAAGFTACGDDEEAAGGTEETGGQGDYAAMLVGKWYSMEVYEKGNMLAYQFFSNGTGKGYQYNETTGRISDMWDIEWTVRGEKLSITELIEGEYDMDTYDIVSITANHVLIREQDEYGVDFTKFSRVSAFPWE